MKTINKLIIASIVLPVMFVVLCATATATEVSACGSYGDNSYYEDYTACSGNAVYWFDECGFRLELYEQCYSDQVCSNAQCMDVNIDCYDNSDCMADEATGDPFCQGNKVYQNYFVATCRNPGTTSSMCVDSTVARLQTTCTGNQTCTNGSCNSVICSTNSQCGTNGPVGGLFCQGNNVYQNYIAYTCNNPGTSFSTCSNTTTAQLQTTCFGNQTCTNGSCTNINTCTPNYQQRCVGTSMYWYDSCGTQGSYVGSCGQTNSTLTVTKTVKNLTSNTAFLTSTYANPSDMLMFMITLKVNGSQDALNVYVRDVLPANLIYNNQLVVARSNNSYGNYSGDIVSGINLNTVSANQTVTITYQVQVAQAVNFVYGTTTLNNVVSTTSSNVGYIPNTSAYVVVNRAGVLGASTVATGLTNNFWVDSFFLPLLITLILIWMWRSGMFFGIRKWVDGKKEITRGYKAERELSKRVAKLSQLQGNQGSKIKDDQIIWK